jgi:hypothetical protein
VRGSGTANRQLTQKKSLLEHFARRLLEKEVAERDELQPLLAGATLS